MISTFIERRVCLQKGDAVEMLYGCLVMVKLE